VPTQTAGGTVRTFDLKMKYIFISRPTWVDDKFKQGLDNFLALLRKTRVSGLESCQFGLEIFKTPLLNFKLPGSE
jgi:hypothetical protein